MNREFEWGPVSKKGQEFIGKEIFENRAYELFDKVKEGDIVVDIGATTGDFTCSILDSKPLHIYSLEPSSQTFPYLVKNTRGYPVTPVNAAIADIDGRILCPEVCHNDGIVVPGITFQTLINLYSLDRIDFFKMDCEGGEYSVFTDENIEYILNNVKVIVGEWHLSTPDMKSKFRNFRDTYLKHFNYEVRDISTTVDIKWDLFNEHFLEHYDEVFFYIRGHRSRS